RKKPEKCFIGIWSEIVADDQEIRLSDCGASLGLVDVKEGYRISSVSTGGGSWITREAGGH
ncbi:MAG: hypothetical protein ACOCTH_03210, partial [Halodesulfurarchaeum sp.]